MPAVEINGTDPSTYSFTAMTAGDLLSSPRLSFDPIIMPKRPGAQVGLRTIGSKPFSITGMLATTSIATAQSNLDNLMSLGTRAQPSTVIFQWSTSRRLIAECLGVQVEPLATIFGVFKYRVTFNFDAPDPPFWQATTQHSVSGIGTGANAQSAPAGDAPLYPQIRVSGPSTSSTIGLHLANSTQTSVESLVFTLTLTSTQFFCVDMDTMTAYVNDSGSFNTGTNRIDTLTSGDFWAILPEYYNYPASSWAIISVQAGASTSTLGTALYYKQWY